MKHLLAAQVPWVLTTSASLFSHASLLSPCLAPKPCTSLSASQLAAVLGISLMTFINPLILMTMPGRLLLAHTLNTPLTAL
jgi:hypothetical protein